MAEPRDPDPLRVGNALGQDHGMGGQYERITFDIGFWFAEGNMQGTAKNNLLSTVEFIDVTDPDYLPSTNPALSLGTNEKEFSVFLSSLGGFTNTGTANIRPDLDKGIVSVLCNPMDDAERDGLCDSDEERVLTACKHACLERGFRKSHRVDA